MSESWPSKDRKALADEITRIVNGQWKIIVGVIDRVDPGFIESLPDEQQIVSTGNGDCVMFRFDRDDDVVILCEAAPNRVTRSTFDGAETAVEVFNYSGTLIESFTQPGADFDPSQN